ncbi:hypothetical protein BSKO_13879 [Bryopsis sp. KO-2023]|nr:hypothetical protein BSKO_13879 [Bryopsis sp. KO-2023]
MHRSFFQDSQQTDLEPSQDIDGRVVEPFIPCPRPEDCTFDDTVCSRQESHAFQDREAPQLQSIHFGDLCWICFDGGNDNRPLVSPCDCPRKVHRACLARWQLQQAGKYEEQCCRFCQKALPDWRPFLTPECLRREMSQAQPTMMVTFNKQVCFVPVKAGADGLSDFTDTIRQKFELENDAAINVTFGCRDPLSGGFIKLEGQGAFNAAVHCAAVSAAARTKEMKARTAMVGDEEEGHQRIS